MTCSLEIKNASKSFGEKMIYHNISYLFEIGSYAIIGANGTGKTVLIEMLAGVSLQDAGEIYLRGIGNSQSQHYKQKLTYIPGRPSFFPDATGNDLLSFISSVKKSKKSNYYIDSLIDGFKLTPHLDTKFKDMSLGTQKKLFLTTIALGDSQLIIMDEPTNALDDTSSELLQEIIKKMSLDKIIITASHDNILLNAINPTIINITTRPVTSLT
jgi:ABC-2 type transport system ATP-binding protein